MKALFIGLVTVFTFNASAYKLSAEASDIFLNKDGKQISPAEAYRSEEPIFHCVKKEVSYNSRTGKPKMKKVD